MGKKTGQLRRWGFSSSKYPTLDVGAGTMGQDAGKKLFRLQKITLNRQKNGWGINFWVFKF
jgi:hypothetical protein